MRHAPRFDHAGVPAHLQTLLFAALAGCVAASACTTAESHADAGTGAGGSSTGSGGLTGTGGSGTAGASGNGSGGNTGAGGHTADSGTGTGGAGTGCASLPLCDDFESGALDTTRWTLIPTSHSGSATIDTIGAHGSGHSLKVDSPSRLYLRNSSVIGTLGSVVHARFYARFMTALSMNHGAIIVTHPMPVDEFTQQPELRFGSQDAVFHWNTDVDANIPDVGPGDSSSVGVTANTWYCIELTINTNGHLNVSIDGNDIPGLTEDGVPTLNIDDAWVGSSASLTRYAAFADFNFGWQGFGGDAMTIWFDDVALSSAPIGCSN